MKIRSRNAAPVAMSHHEQELADIAQCLRDHFMFCGISVTVESMPDRPLMFDRWVRMPDGLDLVGYLADFIGESILRSIDNYDEVALLEIAIHDVARRHAEIDPATYTRRPTTKVRISYGIHWK